ncbi:WD repeat and HMG-box DNA-binding protein 1 [Caerostris darwini]|uniref:WD repeat and HMG-box DNA-binding protein 1 n=1 Tax=Caerostris darwini TaxID=1538125 RepID=A0AAV4UYX1_9ARAC|nr:WD repeat and HMG-box DNA-binding protein 1 [Caerostris darwini]
MEDMRYAHSDGHTDVCYDDSGKYIITCGTDGDIRIWDGFEDDDPKSHHMGNSVSAVTFKEDLIYLSADSFKVEAYTFPEAEFEQIVAQFSTSIYHIVCSKDGKIVACGGGDFVIKVFDTSDKSLMTFSGHNGPVLSVAIDPEGKYLASSGCDGTVRIWMLSSQECIKTLNLFKKSNDFCSSSTLCRLDFSSDGQFLAVPVEKEVRFYERDIWESKWSLSDECVTQTLSIVTYSPFGKYLAAASMNGKILVWDVETKKCISKKFHEKEIAICGLAWHPSGKELVFCDVEGQMGIYSSPFSSSSSKDDIDIPLLTVKKFNDFIDDDVEVDSEDDDIEDTVDDDNDIVIDDDDGDNAFDIGAIKASLEPKIFGEDLDVQITKKEPEPKIQIIEAPKLPVQKPFQPSSTPINLDQRFMLWNNVGIVRCYDTEEENSIDVEFHDANVYHPLHINNTRNHTLAALSTEALLLSSPMLEENTSKLECLHFNTWDSNKEWVVEMPENEEIEAIALGDDFAACVTDRKFVRLFTISGIQCEVFLIPGPVVSCSARGNQLLIVYHKGLGIESDQCLNMMIVKVNLGSQSCAKECFVPLSSKAFLSWLGFTDEGTPCVVDTTGIVSLLNTSCGSKWVPISDTSANMKGKSGTYFVLGLSEIKQEIRCILCKSSRYPSLLPRPNVAVLPFSLPFCELTTDKGKLEEENQRYSLACKRMELLIKEGFDLDFELNSIQKKHMDVLLKMFALATRSDREFRALDAAELMPNPVAVQGAIRYATQRHRIALAERLGEVMNKKICKETEVEEEIEEDFDLPAYEDLSESLISRNASTSNLSSYSKDDSFLKPKPLSRMRGQLEKISEDDEEDAVNEEESNIPSAKNISLIPKSSPVSNPFKASSKAPVKKPEIRNLNSIDEILNNSMNARNSSFTSGEKVLQPKKSRFPTKKNNPLKKTADDSSKQKFGFDLFLEENREKIKASAPPDTTDKELIKIAIKMFKELPKAEKQKYQKNFSSNGIKENIAAEAKSPHSQKELDVKESDAERITNGSKESVGKRKEIDNSDDVTAKPTKKIKTVSDKLSDTTVRKLTQFAFTKTPK